MRLAINVAGLGRSARASAKIKLRQPLLKARVHVGSEKEQRDLLDLAEVLTEEINVKQIEIVSEVGELVNYKLMPNNRLLGPKFGAQFPVIRDKLAELDPEQAASKLQSGQKLELEVGGEQIELNEDEVLVQTESRGGLAVASDKGITVAVDISLTPDLIQEGYARDVVRYINTMRKEGGFALDDRIELFFRSEGTLSEALEKFRRYIKQETLAVNMVAGEPPSGTFTKEFEIDSFKAVLSIIKI